MVFGGSRAGNRPLLVLILSLIFCATGGCKEGTWTLWNAYSARFIDAQGRIVYIRENTTPQSQDLISTPTPVKAVLELSGGVCARLGIHVGDRIEHRLFGTPPAGPVRN